jgi:hypothetical protein
VPDPKPIVHDVATIVKETIRDAQEAVADLKEKPAEIKTGIQQKFSEAKAHVDRFFDQAGNPHHHTIGEVCDVCQSALSSFIPALAPKLREQDKKVDSPAA